jgi:hypothetical protein
MFESRFAVGMKEVIKELAFLYVTETFLIGAILNKNILNYGWCSEVVETLIDF